MSEFIDRITSKFHQDGECWIWHGATGTTTGYATIWHQGKVRLAHRIIYELLVGPIPHGLVLDHLCRNRPCINPDHLEPVTLGENVLRGQGISAENARKTKCHKGHSFDDENTYVTPKGGRDCKICRKEARKRYSQRTKSFERVS